MEAAALAKTLFIVGTLPFVALGSLHAVWSIADDFKPRMFTPVNDQVRLMMNETSIRLTDRSNMWQNWIGFNISHGLGVFSFGLIYLIIAVSDFSVIVSLKPLLLLAIFVAISYFALSLRYWFYAPAIGTALGLACFLSTYLVLLH